MGKYRMYEPWGFQDENNYISKKSSIDEDLAESKKNDEKELKDIEELKETKVDSASYNSDEKKIVFSANGNEVASIDATDFVKDGMIESVELDGTVLKITFNTEAGKEEISVDLKDVFNTDSYYTKEETDAQIAAAAMPLSVKNDAQDEAIASKADSNAVYAKEEVDAMILAKEKEIYNLSKIVGDMGGAVTYELPNDMGNSFNTLMGNNGTVKLTEDVESGRFGPGITARNKVKLNLNTHNLNITGLTISSSMPAIMSRGTQEITIYGKGTIDSGEGICVEANGADSVINLTGSTTTYKTNRNGGELIYCYAGTINIINGTFRNDGEDKKFMLNCYDANYRNGTAKIVVTGGKFYDFDPSNNSAEGEGTSYLADGYHTEASTVTEDGVEHTVYTVKKDA